MSQWSKKRKTKIFFVAFLILIILLIIFSYLFFKKEPTCTDGVQNGLETGVDCGGKCHRACEQEIKGLITWWTRPFAVTENVYNVVSMFENVNFGIGARTAQYEIRIYDKENILVAAPIAGRTFIEPNKRSAIFAPGIRVGLRKPHNAFIRFQDVEEWEYVDPDFSEQLFNIDTNQIEDITSQPKISATVTNVSNQDFTDITLVILIYDAAENAIASSQTLIDSLNAGEEREIYYSWPEPFSGDMQSLEIIPRVNPFTN